MDVKNLCVFWLLLLLLLLKEGLDSSVVAHLHNYCKGNGFKSHSSHCFCFIIIFEYRKPLKSFNLKYMSLYSSKSATRRYLKLH